MFISRAFHINPLQINFYVSLLPAALNFKENMGDHLKNYFQILLYNIQAFQHIYKLYLQFGCAQSKVCWNLAGDRG